ncbi:MAG: type IV secretory system conjugative DNA transfer family protein [Rickettsiales bacterium]|jgi:type IV secretion system protein VirD4|nr:type IV secretory system conjugative DNA transfer family protein [Rickettsiales bacterium]
MSKVAEKNQKPGAHWASPKEIENAGLFEENGFLLGSYKGRRLIDSSYRHVLLFHPLGHGKGVSIAVPNLLFWKESVIINDFKAENYRLTSGYRRNVLGQRVFRWDPANREGATHCYNPLDHVAGKSTNMIQMVDEIQKISRILLPGDDIYDSGTRSLISTLVLCASLDKTKNNTLGGILRILIAGDLDSYLKSALSKFGDRLGWFGQTGIGAFLGNSEEERKFMRNLAITALELWSDPQINATTSRSDFNVADFSVEKSSLYVTVHPADVVRLRPLLQIFYQQCISALTLGDYEYNENRVGVLMLLDEFIRLGRMEFMESALAHSRAYKLKICPFVYDMDSLENTYGRGVAHSIATNSSVKVVCCTNSPNTMNFISNIVGNKIIRMGDDTRGEIPLILPREVAGMDNRKEIVLFESMAIEAEKIKYYEDPEFSGGILEPAPIPTLARE